MPGFETIVRTCRHWQRIRSRVPALVTRSALGPQFSLCKMGRTWGTRSGQHSVTSQRHETLALAPALRCVWVTAEGGREGGRGLTSPASPWSAAITAPSWARAGRAGETLRPASVPRTLVPGAPGGGHSWRRHPRGRVRKWGRGGRERAAAAAGWQTAEVWETPVRSAAGGPPGPPRRRWRRKKVTAAPCSAPTAAPGSGEGSGPGCGPRGAGRPGARAPEFAEDPGARREWPEVLSPGVGR